MYIPRCYTSIFYYTTCSKNIGERHDGVNKIILHSDNATCFASQNHGPFIYNLNTELRENNKATITNWIYTETQTGKSKLDKRFSFLNIKLKLYVEDNNDIVIEDEITNVIVFADGVQGITANLVDASIIGSQKCLNRFFTKLKQNQKQDLFMKWFGNMTEYTW